MGILGPEMVSICSCGLWLAFLKMCGILTSDLCFLTGLPYASLLLYVHPLRGHLACLSVSCLCPYAPLQNGFAIIRPPGHHAEESTAM